MKNSKKLIAAVLSAVTLIFLCLPVSAAESAAKNAAESAAKSAAESAEKNAAESAAKNAAESAAENAAVISVEMFSIGAGYLCEPQCIAADGKNAAEAVLSLLAESGYAAYYSGTPKQSFYLAYIANGNLLGKSEGYVSSAALYDIKSPKTLNITPHIPDVIDEYLSQNAEYYDKNDIKNSPSRLGEFVFSNGSGWMYSINGEFLQVDMASYTLKAGDVMRVQFTLDRGADIGGDMQWQSSDFGFSPAQKDLLTFYIALAENSTQPDVISAKNAALTAAVNYSAEQSEVDGALNTLRSALEAESDEHESAESDEPVSAETEPVSDETEPTAVSTDEAYVTQTKDEEPDNVTETQSVPASPDPPPAAPTQGESEMPSDEECSAEENTAQHTTQHESTTTADISEQESVSHAEEKHTNGTVITVITAAALTAGGTAAVIIIKIKRRKKDEN